MNIPRDVQQRGPQAISRYKAMIAKGESPMLAEMLACQTAPKAETDRELFAGRGTLADQFKGRPQVLAHHIRQARKEGYNPSPNDVYESGLADHPGHHKAFISPSGGRGQAKKRLEEMNTGTHDDGIVRVKKVQRDPADAKKKKTSTSVFISR